jgi:signal peptide peptidase SppA
MEATMQPASNPFLARFADAPALVAADRRDEFEAALSALAADPAVRELVADTGDAFWDAPGARYYRPYVVANGILTIPVRGVLLNDFPFQFGAYATGYGYISKALERGLADPDVRGIAFVINSPGGEVAGNFDLADAIYAARGQKPLRAFAAESAFSAAYSIASAADRISLPRTGGVGSIGVVTAHLDISKAYAEIGFKVTFVFAGAHKVDGNPYEPLPDGVKARIQERVDALYQVFVSTVARNRGLEEQAVRDTEALTFMADEALSNGLADAIGSLDSSLAEFAADLNNPDEGDETMSDNKAAITVASVKADYPDVAKALLDEGMALGRKAATEAATAANAEALKAERARVAALDALAGKVGTAGKAGEIIAAAKADGSSAEATALKLFEAGAHANAANLAALEKDGMKTEGATPAAPGGTAATPQTPDGWKAEYEGSDALKAEFPTADIYVAFKKDEQRQKGGAK